METYNDIRPYRDDEVAPVIARLVADPEVIDSTAAFLFPKGNRWIPFLTRFIARRVIQKATAPLKSVKDLQVFLSGYFERMVRTTTDGLSCVGLEKLDKEKSYLFISNHRDIAMDSGFINYALWSNGFNTSQIAVGDNLFSQGFQADLMRLNKSFVVVRKAKGVKAQFAALTRTSAYIRYVLEKGESVWIAQREGRSKDGIDRTEPAILKMFMLAHRAETRLFREWLDQVNLVPVSVSYEIDPCASRKARELYMLDRYGQYEKAVDEDVQSIVEGITGYKGRVHVNFGAPVRGDFDDADSLARVLDREIVGGLATFPTFLEADALEKGEFGGQLVGRVKTSFESALKILPQDYQQHFLLQYANQLRNKQKNFETD